MAQQEMPLSQGDPTNVSHRALSIGRAIDRLCRMPGSYAITVTVPSNRRAPWLVQFHRLEPMRRMHVNR